MEQRNSSIEIYRSPEGNIELNVKLENDTVWLTQSQMAELFAVDRTSVTRHIRNIYKSQELDEKSTCAKNAQIRKHTLGIYMISFFKKLIQTLHKLCFSLLFILYIVL